MASVGSAYLSAKEQQAWNEAYDRLTHFLAGFGVDDPAHIARVGTGPDRRGPATTPDDAIVAIPTRLTLELAQKRVTDWLAASLNGPDQTPSEIFAHGSMALLLSRVFQTSPGSFLAMPLPEELRQALQETMLVAGPTLNISRMTPRHLDYGPMLNLARQTWHRWDAQEVIVAIVFWAAVYVIFYFWLSAILP